MTLSDEHEIIIDDLRDCVNNFNLFKNATSDNWTIFMIEHIIAACIYPELRHSGIRADGYIQAPDDHSVFPVEVGGMRDDKWSTWRDITDGKTTRILRINFERNVWMLNPKNNEWENTFLDFLRKNGFK